MDRKSTRPREDELTIPNSVNEDSQDTVSWINKSVFF